MYLVCIIVSIANTLTVLDTSVHASHRVGSTVTRYRDGEEGACPPVRPRTLSGDVQTIYTDYRYYVGQAGR